MSRSSSDGGFHSGAAPSGSIESSVKMELQTEAARARSSVLMYHEHQETGKRQKNPQYKPERSRKPRFAKLKKQATTTR
ncbi:hypothetical protein PR003_g6115 [Phytophthora rubi]|uniref:Uncharacterized protein n=1 Tax=Phytophthora rubi TaxID=129364 RepID=A0A6A3KJV0_9STRA|nr:hypothetical protein PR002_g17187 [Phytophthora rubi]KAE9043725.1 hypothetical protein PR001_g5678 [Phytophthora rubi]KAE9349028.1 hypothetical protein PR003_g6115 [Phytophthora rubi]